MIHKQSNCLGPLSYFLFFGKIGPFLPIFWKKLLFWYKTFAVVLGIRLIRRSNHDTGSSCHSSSSVIALLVVWSDHLSVYKDLRSFVETCDKFRRSLRWIAIHKKSNCLGWLSYFPIFWENWTFFCHFFGNNRGFGWLFLLFHGYNYFRRNIPLNLMKTSGADLTCSTLIPSPRRRPTSGAFLSAVASIIRRNGLDKKWRYNENSIKMDALEVSGF